MSSTSIVSSLDNVANTAISSAISVMPTTATSETQTSSLTVPIATAPSSTADSDGSASEKATADLDRWQAKFKRAADKGSEDLAARIAQITTRQIEGQVQGTAHALVTQLEEASSDVIKDLKAAIIVAVNGLAQDASDEDKESAIEGVRWSIRSSGKSVKEKAQNLRSWKVEFDQQTESLVDSASRSTLNVMDGIRDLGLQEIGMRWASLEHVTYDDWAEYHNLKETFDEWRSQVELVAKDHEGLASARREAEQVEETGMAIAEDAAKELARLKDVATWKIYAQDTSDDFETRQIPAAAARMGQKIMQKISSIAGSTTEQGYVESLISDASKTGASIRSSVSSAASVVSNSVAHLPSAASEVLVGASQSAAESVSSAVDNAASAASQASKSISSMIGSPQSTSGRITSAAAESAGSLSSQASAAQTNVVDSALRYLDGAKSSAAAVLPSGLSALSNGPASAASTTSSVSDHIETPADYPSPALSRARALSSEAEDAFSATVAPSASSVLTGAGSVRDSGIVDDFMDGAEQASSSLLNKINEAGEGYVEVTKTLAHAMRQETLDGKAATYTE